MPIYPYLCENCNYEFDRLQKISDDTLKVCPECGAEALRKKLTAAAFHLKGTGWYETDFKDKDKKGDQKADKKDDGKETSGTGKSDTDDKKSKSTASDSKQPSSTSGSDAGKSSKSTSTPADSG